LRHIKCVLVLIATLVMLLSLTSLLLLLLLLPFWKANVSLSPCLMARNASRGFLPTAPALAATPRVTT
jgi:hypothetical protein